jgi:hypothetical protein
MTALAPVEIAMYNPINKLFRSTGGNGRAASQESGSTASIPDSVSMVAADPQNGPPVDNSPPNASEVTSSKLRTTEGPSSSYTVGFYNETPDSTGHEHHVRQGEVDVTAPGADQAIAGAIVEFEEGQDVSTWRDRANSIECVQTEDKG